MDAFNIPGWVRGGGVAFREGFQLHAENASTYFPCMGYIDVCICIYICIYTYTYIYLSYYIH